MSSAKTTRSRRLGFLTAFLAGTLLLLASAAPAFAVTGWSIDSVQNPTIAPGEQSEYIVIVKNTGDEPMDGSQIDIVATLPPGLTAVAGELFAPFIGFFECTALDGSPIVAGVTTSVRCSTTDPVLPVGATSGGLNWQQVKLTVEAEPSASGGLSPHFEVSGGGAAPASTIGPILVSSEPPGFGIDSFESRLGANPAGDPFTQAGGHPFNSTTTIEFNTKTDPVPISGSAYPVEPVKDISTEVPPGLLGDPTAVGTCTAAELAHSAFAAPQPLCPPSSQVGTQVVRVNGYYARESVSHPYPMFNMVPPPGVAARFGFNIFGVVTVIDAEVRRGGDYGVTLSARNISEGLALAGTTTTFWGTPASEAHRADRACPDEKDLPAVSGFTCPSGGPEVPFLRNPTSCSAQGLPFIAHADSWFDQGDFDSATTRTHRLPGLPYLPEDWGPDVGIDGCEDVPVKGTLAAQPTTLDAESSSGLSVKVEVPNPGLSNPDGISSSDLKKVKVSLPQGVTINPSQAEGLGVCMPAQYESTELSFFPTPGKGCPSESKIGTALVHTPVLDEPIGGDVFIAAPDDPATGAPGAENPFDSLLAMYVVLEEPQRGVLIKLPGKIETDERTGRIVSTFSDLPQLPFDSFELKLREGARAPLITPPTCGTYTTETEITGHSDPANPIVSKSTFEITRGIGGAPCPSGGLPPFKPGFSAGSINNNAGSFSEFVMRLTRNDGEQDMTKFSSILPPGVSAKIAGVGKCPDTAIQAAKAKTGKQELANPSCPSSSQIGRTLVGAGVGSVLTRVPGSLYLAGPHNGAPLSVVSITPAVAGPFDVGTVVVQEALTLDPVTGEVHVDGDRSDPIPHILKGIPLKLRDLRIYVDRDKFTINPTSCDPSSVRATLFGSHLDVFSSSDDVPVDLASRYQAANCLNLAFKPSLKLKLRGGTKRGSHPGLRAVVTPRRGDANIDGATVTLPRSAFLEQAHIRTICTRVQFAANACPKGAIYGHVTAWTPLLDEPLSGPVYLRSSNNKLPDLVFDLHGIVDIEVPGRIDSVRTGGIRTTFSSVPDAPISRVVLTMQGGKKGLIVNSADLCAAKNRAKVAFTGQNGKRHSFRPVVKAQCGKARRGKRNR